MTVASSSPLSRCLRLADRFRPVEAGNGGAAAVFTGWQRAGLLLAFALLVVLRLPHAWAHGRLLGEEGGIFLPYAWHRPALDAAFHSFGGYLNLGANLPMVLAARLVRAGILPLEYLPYLTMGTALLFQLLPGVLILTGRSRWLSSRWAVIGALLVIAISPMTEEASLNTLHIQFHLALCAALILTLDRPSARAARIGYATLLFLAPLCGPGAIVLLPLYALKTLVERSGTRLAQAVALATGTAIQLLVFFTPSPMRGQVLDPATLAAILFVRFVALPFDKASHANRLGKWVYASHQGGGMGWWLVAAAAALYFGWLVWIALRDRRDPAIWMILSGLSFAAISFGGGMIANNPFEWFSVGSGQRYNLLPLVLFGLALIVLARHPAGRPRRVFVLLGILVVIAGVRGYFKSIGELGQGPSWAAEVAVWRDDHRYPLRVWPKRWTADLSDEDRPCSPPSTPGAADTDPSYCESAWQKFVTPPPPPPRH